MDGLTWPVWADADPTYGSSWHTRSLRTAEIRNANGGIVFRQEEISAPSGWSDLAVTIAAQKYFVKTGVPTASGREDSVYSMVEGVARSIADAGLHQGYFNTPTDGDNFETDLKNLLIEQRAAFNSPVWFNVRQSKVYGIKGPKGNYAWNGTYAERIDDGFARPQCSACFILSIRDSLVGDKGLLDTWKSEARLFKGGSGSGLNFSPIREKDSKLSGGGTSSGLISFLEVGDKNAGSMKSGGVARRAAKMVCLDADHPEIFEFIRWKSREEKKAKALVAAGFSDGMEGEAYTTVSGQNSNNSVRLTDDFMRAVEADGDWQLLSRIGGKVVRTVKAREVWRAIAQASWECADPGVQFDTTINDWNTTPWSGRIEASNPCSEYMHISDSACNLSSIRLTKFFRADGVFDLSGFRQAVDVLIVAQDILVDYSSYPTEAIALGAHSFRQLGLGYADLGAVLMRLGLGYGSPTGRLLAAAITSLMTAQAYETSTRLAQTFGPFERFQENRADVLRVMEKHSDASTGLLTKLRGYPPSPHHNLIENIVQKANAVWEAAYSQAKEYGVRNAQLTLLAPTGTIGFLMDCVTTGVEPLLALVQYKNLIGGGRLKLINEDLPLTLARLGYSSEQVQSLVTYVVGHGTLSGYAGSADFINAQKILPDDWQRIEKVLRGAYDIREAFSEAVLGPALMSRLGAKADRPDWNLLEHFWGFADLRDISNYALGHGSLEGSELKDEHLPIFDTAIASAGGRCLTPEDHLLMMAAVQPFLSGAISKTCNIPESSTVEEIERLHFYAWKLGLKAVAVYRDNCKGVQAVSTRKDEKKTETTDPSPVRTDPAFKRAQRKLPKVRHGLTWALKLDGHKVYIRSGEYEDGTLGEVFVDLAKEGSTLGGLVGMWAKMVSLGLQYGVPLEELTETFTHTRFEPFGLVTNHDTIRLATSIVDLVLRVLAVHYLKRTDLQHTHPEAMDDGVIPPPTDTYTVEPDSVRKASADGPPCGTCGNLTYRNGSCYRCHSCGSTTGCS